MSNSTPMFATSGIAHCPYSIALEHAAGYLKRFNGTANEAFVMFPYRAFGLPIRGGLQRRVALSFHMTEDNDDRSRAHEALSFHWEAGARYLPNLHGILSFRIAGDGLTEIVLQYGYTPPFGLTGALFDRIVGRYFARVTGHVLLEQIIGEIEVQERTFANALRVSEGQPRVRASSIAAATSSK